MDDDEYEEERTVVMIELQGLIDSNVVLQEQESFKLLGVETEQPIFQVGNCIFSGEYEDTSGTVVFFEKASKEGEKGNTDMRYMCKTDKKLSMKRVFLKKKKSEEPVEQNMQDALECATSRQESHVARHDDEFACSSPKQRKEDLTQEQAEVAQLAEMLPQGEPANDSTNVLNHAEPGSNGLGTCSEVFEEPIVVEGIGFAQAQASHSNDVGKASDVNENATPGRVASAAHPLEDSGSLTLSNGSKDQLSSHMGIDPTPPLSTKEADVINEVTDSVTSSEFEDFIVVSETDGSNEASRDCYDSAVPMVKKPVQSSEPTASTSYERRDFPLLGIDKSDSDDSEDEMPYGVNVCGSVMNIVDMLVSEVQYYASPCQSSASASADQGLISGDIADSASHLIQGSGNSVSDSSLPLICDSASSERKPPSETDDVLSESRNSEILESDDVPESDIRGVASTSEAMDVSEMEQKEQDDAFGNDAMDSPEGAVTHSQSADSVGSSRNEASVMSPSGFDEHFEPMETSANEEVSASFGGDSSLEEQCHQVGSGSRINSTVSEVSNTVEDSRSELCNAGTSEVGAGTSQSEDFSCAEYHGASCTGKTNDSADSTSNQIILLGRDEENLKLSSGIDSTTNESEDRILAARRVRFSRESSCNAVRTIPNGIIDSTMNHFRSSQVEDVDFEMREANDLSGVDEAVPPPQAVSNVSHSIDSTSCAVTVLSAAHSPSCAGSDVSDASTPNSDSSSAHLNKEASACEVTESCSGSSSAVAVTESNQNPERASYLQITEVYPDENEDNSSSCKVTESHIDEDDKCTYSYDDVQFAGTSESSSFSSEVTDSTLPAGSSKSHATESSSFHNKNVAEVSESCLHASFDEESQSFEDSPNCGATECCPSSSKSFVSCEVTESRMEVEEDVSCQVTESFEQNCPQLPTNSSDDSSANAVSNSTNISYFHHESVGDRRAAQMLSENSLCEVTDSSSHVQEQEAFDDESLSYISVSSERDEMGETQISDSSVAHADASTSHVGDSTSHVGDSTSHISASASLIDASTSQISASTCGASTSEVGASTSHISASTSDVGASTSDISASTSDISASTSDVGASTSDISASTSHVGASTSDISASTSHVHASTSDISASTSDISASTSDISASTSDISASTSHVGVLTSRIGASTSHVGASASHVGASASHVGASTSHISASTSHIGASTSHVGASTSHISASASHVGASTFAEATESTVSQGNVACSGDVYATIISQDPKEPSSSEITVTTAPNILVISASGVMSSANGYYSLASLNQRQATNEVNNSSAASGMEHSLSGAADFEIQVSNSSERNAADSTEGSSNNCHANNGHAEWPSSGTDNSKLPSSTSN